MHVAIYCSPNLCLRVCTKYAPWVRTKPFILCLFAGRQGIQCLINFRPFMEYLRDALKKIKYRIQNSSLYDTAAPFIFWVPDDNMYTFIVLHMYLNCIAFHLYLHHMLIGSLYLHKKWMSVSCGIWSAIIRGSWPSSLCNQRGAALNTDLRSMQCGKRVTFSRYRKEKGRLMIFFSHQFPQASPFKPFKSQFMLHLDGQ